MKQQTKKFILWLLIYGFSFGIFSAVFIDYFNGKSIFLLKNIIGGLFFGSFMSYVKIRTEKRRQQESKN